jgi:hypothetical protein
MKAEDGGEWLTIDKFVLAIKAVDTVIEYFDLNEFEDLRKEYMATINNDESEIEIEIIENGGKCGCIVM